MAQPTAGTIPYAVSVTPEGGDTWFCVLGAAYETLPPGLRVQVDGKRALHSATTNGRVRIHLTDDSALRRPR